MKQWILSLAAVLLAVCLLAGCGGRQSVPESVPDAAPAAPEGQEDTPEEPPEEPAFVEAAPEDLLYEYVEELGGIMVYGYTGSAEGISIPVQLDGEPVVQIGDGSFPQAVQLEDGSEGDPEGAWPVKRLELPEGLVTIANNAFCWCTELETVIIPSSVTEIPNWAFYKCTAMEAVTIPGSVVKIGHSAF